jgi:hypothetical protein
MVPIIAFARASSSISSSLRKLAVPNFDHSLIPNLELLQILKITGNGNKYVTWSIYQNVRNASVTHRFAINEKCEIQNKISCGSNISKSYQWSPEFTESIFL